MIDNRQYERELNSKNIKDTQNLKLTNEQELQNVDISMF